MCGHGPRISRTCLSIFFPQNQFPESMVPRLIKERGCGCRNWSKSFIAFLLFYRSFGFPSRFFEPKWSIAFFSGIWVSSSTATKFTDLKFEGGDYGNGFTTLALGKLSRLWPIGRFITYPICSMYGIFTYTWVMFNDF